MRRLLEFISPWALAGIAVWMVIMAVAYNWAIPIYATITAPGLCPSEPPGCPPATFTVTQPETTLVAIVVASVVTASVAAIVVLARRFSARRSKSGTGTSPRG